MAVMKLQHFVSWPVSLLLCQYLTAVLETETLQDSSLSISLLSQGCACEPCRLSTSQEGAAPTPDGTCLLKQIVGTL